MPPDGILAQVVLQGVSDLPEDRFITTYHFGTVAGPSSADRDAVADALTSFVVDQAPNATMTLHSMLGPQVSNSAEIRLYDLAATPPRTPTIYDLDISAPTGTPLPAEVALCGSYYAGQNVPRKRGRIFWGPLKSTVGDLLDGEFRPTVAARSSLRYAMQQLVADTGGGQNWCVYSRTDDLLRSITAGWVDAAFATQRRRGLAPTARSVFP